MSKITGNGPVVKSTTPTIEQQEVTAKSKADPKVSSGEVTDKIGDIPGAGQTHAASELPPEAIITSLERLAASLEASSGGRVADTGDVDISIKPDAILNDGFISNTLTASGALVNQDQGALANTMLQSLQSSLQTTQRSSYPQTFRKGSYEPGKVIPKQFQWSDGVSGSGSSITLNPSTEDRLTSFAEGTLPQDPMAFVQFVLRESYLETTNCLMDHANKVRFFNDLKKEIRAKMQGIRDVLAENAGKGDDEVIGNTPTYKANMTWYGQTGGENMTSTDRRSAEEVKAANATKAAKATNAAKADEDYKRDKAETEEFSVAQKTIKKTKDYGGVESSAGIETQGDRAISAAADVIGDMTPEEWKAFKNDPNSVVHMRIMSSDNDDWNDWSDDVFTDGNSISPKKDETQKDFIKRLEVMGEEVIEDNRASMDSADHDGGQGELDQTESTITISAYKGTKPKYSATQLAENHPDSQKAQAATTTAGWPESRPPPKPSTRTPSKTTRPSSTPWGMTASWPTWTFRTGSRNSSRPCR